MGEVGNGACTASASGSLGYRRREPERTLLHTTVRAHLKTFLAKMEQRGDGAGLPGFVISEFERYLACGILAHGFARVRCSSCGDEMLVAFSCKGRGFCPSCTTRRMQGTATHLLDRVLPHVPMRQWVLSLPRWARFLLARDPRLITRALDIALRAIFSLQRRRARVRSPSCIMPSPRLCGVERAAACCRVTLSLGRQGYAHRVRPCRTPHNRGALWLLATWRAQGDPCSAPAS